MKRPKPKPSYGNVPMVTPARHGWLVIGPGQYVRYIRGAE